MQLSDSSLTLQQANSQILITQGTVKTQQTTKTVANNNPLLIESLKSSVLKEQSINSLQNGAPKDEQEDDGYSDDGFIKSPSAKALSET